MNISDAIGLGIFTVVGINTAWNAGYHQLFLLVFVGVITGVGGGLLRDVMAQEKHRSTGVCVRGRRSGTFGSYDDRIIGSCDRAVSGHALPVESAAD